LGSCYVKATAAMIGRNQCKLTSIVNITSHAKIRDLHRHIVSNKAVPMKMNKMIEKIGVDQFALK